MEAQLELPIPIRTVVSTVTLEATGARGGSCYYTLSLERLDGAGWLVCKSSGIPGRTPAREAWFRQREAEARRLYERIVGEKLRPERKSPRKYRSAQPRR